MKENRIEMNEELETSLPNNQVTDSWKTRQLYLPLQS
jgi:hypothetical protein